VGRGWGGGKKRGLQSAILSNHFDSFTYALRVEINWQSSFPAAARWPGVANYDAFDSDSKVAMERVGGHLVLRVAARNALDAAHEASHVPDLELGSSARVAAQRQHALEVGRLERVLVQVDHFDIVRCTLAAHAAQLCRGVRLDRVLPDVCIAPIHVVPREKRPVYAAQRVTVEQGEAARLGQLGVEYHPDRARVRELYRPLARLRVARLGVHCACSWQLVLRAQPVLVYRRWRARRCERACVRGMETVKRSI
jgi:hypothetical protein